jgi:predicted metalloendopeptidase
MLRPRLALVAFSCACLTILSGCETPPPVVPPKAPPPPPLISGLDAADRDDTVRPQDDFYQYVNGKWLASAAIPADKGSYGSWDIVEDATREQVRAIIEGAAGASGNDPDQKRIADLYASFMDEARVDALGLKPLEGQYKLIDEVRTRQDVAGLLAFYLQIGVSTPFDLSIDPDRRESTRTAVYLRQSGLGMPDRDYYLSSDPKLKKTRADYQQHIQKVLALSGDKDAARSAAAILKLETELANAQWARTEDRDAVKTYNKIQVARLDHELPGYDWKTFMTSAGIAGHADYVIVREPSYFVALGRSLQQTPLPVWRSYFRWKLTDSFASFLSKPFVDEDFAFNGTVLGGIAENEPRWKRGVRLVNGSIGESVGKLYVAQYFPPASKARIDELVQNLLAAYRADIDTLGWMSPATKKAAQDKLAKIGVKVGYPKRWRDYSTLKITREDLLGNVERSAAFEFDRNLRKLGQPVDREEWLTPPQTVNAFYSPVRNEITFPAAVLQPPFFNPRADSAANYGAIGAIIGHEISHGFDDQGSRYDGDGNLHDWWSEEDRRHYAAKSQVLAAQYSAVEPVPGFHVDGARTLGENIADNSGLAIAYKAYQISLAGQSAPVIDGFSGDQRFYMGYAQAWRTKLREPMLIAQLKSDFHAPDAVRGELAEKNQPGFFDAFGVRPGDKMYLAPEDRVLMW